MQNANDSARDGDPARMFESMTGFPQAYAQMFELWRRMVLAPVTGSPEGDGGTASASRTMLEPALDPQVLAGFMAQSYMIVIACGLRCMSGFANIHSRYLTMARSIFALGGGASASREDQMIMLDELRAYLRELMELPYRECQRAMAELQTLESTVLPQAGPADHQRRWKAKP